MLEFDAENHEYSDEQGKVFGVTNTLKLAGRINDKFMNQEACRRGNAVHAACHFRILDDLNEASVNQVIRPFLRAFDDFLFESEFKPVIEFCEKRMIHSHYRYAGQPDLVGLLHNYPALIDIKSGALAYCRYQTAAYSEFPELAEYFGCVPRRYGLQLNGKGKLFLTEFDDPNDFAVFLDDLEKARQVA